MWPASHSFGERGAGLCVRKSILLPACSAEIWEDIINSSHRVGLPSSHRVGLPPNPASLGTFLT